MSSDAPPAEPRLGADGITRPGSSARLVTTLRVLAGRVRVRVAAVLTTIYLVGVLIVTLSPTPVDRPYAVSLARFIDYLHHQGMPSWIGYAQIESTSNVLMFLPLGFLAALVLRRKDWWIVAVVAPAFASFIEAAQALFLPARFATAADVIANGLGGAIGAALAWLVRLLLLRRDRRRAAAAAERVRG